MKWVLILALLSCGKHQEPKAPDLADTDGDQKVNFLEGELEKYVADYEPLKTVKGVMRFTTSQSGQIQFSNKVDLKQETLAMVAGSMKPKEDNSYFAEWSILRMKLPKDPIETQLHQNNVHLQFEKPEIIPSELVLVDKNQERSLAPWTSLMKVVLSREEFNGVMDGSLKFVVKKKLEKPALFNRDQEESIKAKTYRVNFHDGKKSKILYVATALPLEKLLPLLNITESVDVSDETFFSFSGEPGIERWYKRTDAQGNSALVFTTIQNLKEKFLERFDRKVQDLKRLGGISNGIEFSNRQSTIFIKIRPKAYVLTTFHEGFRRRHGGPTGRCYRIMHKVKDNRTLPRLTDFLSNLDLNNGVVDNLKLEERYDDLGIFWEGMLETPPDNFSLQLTKLTIPDLHRESLFCRGVPKGWDTAPKVVESEAEMSFTVESFVEKVQ